MATYYCSQSGSGLMDGTSPDNAWTNFGGTNPPVWGTLDNDSSNVLYLLGTFTSYFNVASFTGTGITIRGDYPGSPCVIHCTDAQGFNCYNRTFDIAPLYIKNLTIDGVNTTSAMQIGLATNVYVSGITCIGTIATDYGIQIVAGTNINVDNCTITGYGTYGIDWLCNNNNGTGLTVTNCTATNIGTEETTPGADDGTGKGIGVRCLTGSISTDILIQNCICNDNGESGISLRSGTSTSDLHGIIIDSCTTNLNGKYIWGTGIECSGLDATSLIRDIEIKNCVANDNIDFDYITDGSDGVGIRFDDWVYNSIIHGCRCSGNVTGIVNKYKDNYVIANIIYNNEKGIRHSANVGFTSESGYFYNNTITNSTVSGFENLNPASDGAVLYNNIISGCATGIYWHSGATITEEYNNLFNNTANYLDETLTPVALDLTDITSDPNLYPSSKPDTHNADLYHAGKPLGFAAKDFKGHKFNNPPTIGAYEFTSGSEAIHGSRQ